MLRHRSIDRRINGKQFDRVLNFGSCKLLWLSQAIDQLLACGRSPHHSCCTPTAAYRSASGCPHSPSTALDSYQDQIVHWKRIQTIMHVSQCFRSFANKSPVDPRSGRGGQRRNLTRAEGGILGGVCVFDAGRRPRFDHHVQLRRYRLSDKELP